MITDGIVNSTPDNVIKRSKDGLRRVTGVKKGDNVCILYSLP
jgi:hypothetical protein